MNIKKHIGIILILLSLIISLKDNQEVQLLLKTLEIYAMQYFAFIILIIGIYLLYNPKQKKTRRK